MLAEHKLPASRDAISALPDAARQLLEAGGREKPLACQEFHDLWPKVSKIRYVVNKPLTTRDMADSLAVNIHEGDCRNTLCRELSKISDEIHTHPQNSGKNGALIKKGERKISTSKTRSKPSSQIPL